jgi:hypothetical protein
MLYYYVYNSITLGKEESVNGIKSIVSYFADKFNKLDNLYFQFLQALDLTAIFWTRRLSC